MGLILGRGMLQTEKTKPEPPVDFPPAAPDTVLSKERIRRPTVLPGRKENVEPAVVPVKVPQGIKDLAEALRLEFSFAQSSLEAGLKRQQAIKECRHSIYALRGLAESLSSLEGSMKQMLREAVNPELKSQIEQLGREKEKYENPSDYYARLMRPYSQKIEYAKGPDSPDTLRVDGDIRTRGQTKLYCEHKLGVLIRERDELIHAGADRLRDLARQIDEKMRELKQAEVRRADEVRQSEEYQALKKRRFELKMQIQDAAEKKNSQGALLGEELDEAGSILAARRAGGWIIATAAGLAVGGACYVYASVDPLAMLMPLIAGLLGYLTHTQFPFSLSSKLRTAEKLLKPRIVRLQKVRDDAFGKLSKFYGKHGKYLPALGQLEDKD